MSLSSKSNINPKLWGPYFWQTIHFVSYGYPSAPTGVDKETYFAFYENMMKVLPCDKCSKTSRGLFKTSNINSYLGSRDDLIKWTYIFHKSVNDELGKNSPTFEEFMYNFKNRSNNNNIKNLFIAAIILSLCIYLYVLCTAH